MVRLVADTNALLATLGEQSTALDEISTNISAFAQHAEDANVRNTASESARQRQAHAGTLSALCLIAVGERANFVFRCPEPGERS